MVEQVDSIKNVLLPEALSERYLSYAISTIVSRSLPDVRDGLKPVHRRLLYAMYQLRLNPESGFKKCARVVGDVIGKYHPHGDSAVYEAMVRLSQEFSVRYPLVDGQGNFGNIDGDNAAAMRYTEAKLTRAAMLLLEGLTENAVDMLETYDGEEQEPVVMPSSYPNILANGATGIAVGMATNIPPHNVSELIDACLLLIKKPNASIKDLCSHVQGPDFPTAGIITTSQEDIMRAYETGKGAFTVRAKWHKKSSTNGTYQVIVTEIPFGVTKSKLIERIANLLLDKKLPLLYNIYDESTVDIRIVLEPRSRTVNAEFLMEQLFLHTDLQIRYNMNLNVLDHTHTPKVMNIKEVLNEFLQHRNIVLLRRSQYRLDKVLLRIEILEGLLIAYKNLDKVIEIIRFADDPKQELVATFKLTENQVNAILNMRLRALHKLEENVVLDEHKDLCIERDKLLNLIADSGLQWKSISNELRQVKKEFNQSTLLGKRKSQFMTAPEIDDSVNEIMVEKEAIVVIVSKLGWLRAFKGHHIDLTQIKFKDGDELGFVIDGGYTTDKLLIFTSKGKFYTLLCDKLPPARGQGEPIRLLVNMDSDENIVQVFKHVPDNKIMLVSSNSKGFLVNETKVIAQTKNGKQIMSVSDKIKATHCVIDTKGEYCAIIGNNRKMLVFKKSEIAELTKGQGTLLQRYKDGYISDIIFFNLEDGLKWPYRSSYRHLLDFGFWLGERAQSGHMAPHGFPRSNKFYREK